VNIPEVTPQQQFLLPLALRQHQPDLYHYPNFDLPVLQPFRSVFTVHDLTYVRVRTLYLNGRRLKNFYTKMIMQLGARKATKIIAVSESTKRDLIDILHVSKEKIEVIPEAVDEVYLNGNLSDDANSFSFQPAGLPLAVPFFLFVGERRPHKNLVRLIEAFDLFKKKYASDCKLVIAGKPYSSFREPEQKAQALNRAADVLFLGYVDDHTLRWLYQHALALVCVSIYEGFGLPLLEAMACGTPVVTSSISAMPEVADGAALTINPYNVVEISDALYQLMRDVGLRQTLRQQGKHRVKQFSWKHSAERTLNLYESILTQVSN
jgi:glycosyltransferase involved in cell wall biosynthesis